VLGGRIAVPEFLDVRLVEEERLAVVAAFTYEKAARHRRIIASMSIGSGLGESASRAEREKHAGSASGVE
jgi:hypothetical protein